ncbi:MAG: thymidylate synthase [archaeon]
MVEIKKPNTMEGWKAVLKHILNNGVDFVDRDERKCREVLNLIIVIEDPSKDSKKPVEIMNSFDKWVYPSLEEIEQIIFTKQPSATYGHSTYGPRIFNFGKVLNQIDNFAIPLLKDNPTSRRALVCVYNPLEDSNITSKEVISLTHVYFKVQGGKLHTTFFIRSNDCFMGWPVNLFQMHALQCYVADNLGMPTGSLTTISASAHIFEDNFETIKKVIGQ